MPVPMLPERPIDTSWMLRCGAISVSDSAPRPKERPKPSESLGRRQRAREIVQKAAEEFGFTRDVITGPSQSPRFTEARKLAADSLEANFYTPDEIGRELKRRPSATYARRRARK